MVDIPKRDRPTFPRALGVGREGFEHVCLSATFAVDITLDSRHKYIVLHLSQRDSWELRQPLSKTQTCLSTKTDCLMRCSLTS